MLGFSSFWLAMLTATDLQHCAMFTAFTVSYLASLHMIVDNTYAILPATTAMTPLGAHRSSELLPDQFCPKPSRAIAHASSITQTSAHCYIPTLSLFDSLNVAYR